MLAEAVFLLLRVQRLARQIHRGLRGIDGRAVLLHSKLRVLHLDAHLVLNLLQRYFGLAVFQFGPHRHCRFRRAVAQTECSACSPAPLSGAVELDELAQRIAVVTAGRGSNGSGS